MLLWPYVRRCNDYDDDDNDDDDDDDGDDRACFQADLTH